VFAVFVVNLVMVVHVEHVLIKVNIKVLVGVMLGEEGMLNKYNTRFENGVWVCDCPHYKFRGTNCRHILQKLLDLRGKTDGVRDTSLEAYIQIISDPSSLNERYQDILVAISEMDRPPTAFEVALYLGFDDPNKTRPRINELANNFYKPFLEEKGKEPRGENGTNVFVWGLTRQGELLVDDLQKVLS